VLKREPTERRVQSPPDGGWAPPTQPGLPEERGVPVSFDGLINLKDEIISVLLLLLIFLFISLWDIFFFFLLYDIVHCVHFLSKKVDQLFPTINMMLLFFLLFLREREKLQHHE